MAGGARARIGRGNGRGGRLSNEGLSGQDSRQQFAAARPNPENGGHCRSARACIPVVASVRIPTRCLWPLSSRLRHVLYLLLRKGFRALPLSERQRDLVRGRFMDRHADWIPPPPRGQVPRPMVEPRLAPCSTPTKPPSAMCPTAHAARPRQPRWNRAADADHECGGLDAGRRRAGSRPRCNHADPGAVIQRKVRLGRSASGCALLGRECW